MTTPPNRLLAKLQDFDFTSGIEVRRIDGSLERRVSSGDVMRMVVRGEVEGVGPRNGAVRFLRYLPDAARPAQNDIVESGASAPGVRPASGSVVARTNMGVYREEVESVGVDEFGLKTRSIIGWTFNHCALRRAFAQESIVKVEERGAENTGKVGRGRPTRYTKAIAERICERLAKGETLRAICRDDDLPQENTVRGWANKDLNGFYAQYARSRDIGVDAMVDEILEIADTPREGKKTKLTGCVECGATGKCRKCAGEGVIEVDGQPVGCVDCEGGNCAKCGGKGGISEVTTGDMVERTRLQVDTRKWYVSKLAPKRYGERPDMADSKQEDEGMKHLAEAVRQSPQ